MTPEEQDELIRKLIEENPSYLDTTDYTPFCYDNSLKKWLCGKDFTKDGERLHHEN